MPEKKEGILSKFEKTTKIISGVIFIIFALFVAYKMVFECGDIDKSKIKIATSGISFEIEAKNLSSSSCNEIEKNSYTDKTHKFTFVKPKNIAKTQTDNFSNGKDLTNNPYKKVIENIKGVIYTLKNKNEFSVFVYQKNFIQNRNLTLKEFIKDSMPISNRKKIYEKDGVVIYDMELVENEFAIALFTQNSENFYQVIAVFKNSSDKDELQNIIQSFKLL